MIIGASDESDYTLVQTTLKLYQNYDLKSVKPQQPVCLIQSVFSQVAEHFADRMPDEYFMILDDNRKYAVIHPGKHYSGQQADRKREISEQKRYMKEKAQKMYLRELSDEEMKMLRQTEILKDEYTELWKTFFHTIGIEQRKNPTCQRNLMPIWKRKHAVEFMQ